MLSKEATEYFVLIGDFNNSWIKTISGSEKDHISTTWLKSPHTKRICTFF